AVALREFRQRIWDAAQVAQPDVLAPQYGRQPLPQVMADLITAVNRLIQKQVPTRDRPPPPPADANDPRRWDAPPSLAYYLTQLTADVRAALQVAYYRTYGMTLDSAITLNCQDGTNRLSSRERTAALEALYTGVQPPPPPSIWDQLAAWVDNAANWVGNTWNQAVDAVANFDLRGALEDAWTASTTFVTNTARMMVTDPIGFVQSVGEGIVNTG